MKKTTIFKVTLIVIAFGLFILCPESKAQVDLKKGLVAYYPFNGNANDESENKNNAIVNGAIFTSDKFGNISKAFSFNGVDNFISVDPNSSLNLIDSFSISFGIKLYSTKSHHIIVKGDNSTTEYSVTVDSSRICFNQQNKQIIAKSQTKLSLYEWYYVTITFANSLARIYINGTYDSVGKINGTYDAQGKIIGLFPSANTGITIGSFPQTERTWNLDGALDEIRIYNRSLSQSEIKVLYDELK